MFSQSDLRLQREVQDELTKLKYPDAQRVSKEIVQFSRDPKEIVEIILRLKANEPWEQIKGWAEFFGLRLKVTKDTLIPRIETEELVQLALKVVKPNSTIIDVGTGTGVIIIALAKRLGDMYKFVATDISKKALKVAKENIETLGVEVKTYEADLIKDIPVKAPYMIIANLPYIPTPDYNKLDASVKEYEPKIALEGGKDGNRDIYRLLEQLTKPLPYEILLELHPESMKNLLEYCKTLAEYTPHVIKDFRGMDRFLRLELINPPQPE